MPVNQTGTITVKILAQDLASGNIGKFIGSLDRAAKQSGLLGWAVRGTAMSMGSMLNPAMLVSQGIGAVVDQLGQAQAAYREDQVSQEKLRTALEANIQAWDGNTDAIEKVIASRMKLGFSDDEQRSSLALLVSQVEDVNDALAIQRTAMDLARLKGMSLADASTLLAKAYLGSTTGLQKMGIQLKKGSDGMEAIAAVQQRAAGQAKSWAETSTGAAEAFNIKVGEMQEKVGEFVDGASRQFLGFLSGVVDVLDGPDGATADLRELSKQIYAVHQAAAAGGGETPIERMNKELQAWADTLKLQELNGTPESFTWLQRLGPDTLRNFGAASADTLADVRALAQSFIDTGGTFSEFAAIIRQKISQEVTPTFNVLTSTWGTSMDSMAEDASDAGTGIYGGLVKPVKHAFKAMFATMDSQKEPWRSAWKTMAEWAKNPFKPAAFENWLERRADKAVQKAREAAKNGQPEVARRWRALAAVMRRPVLAALADTEDDIQKLVSALMIIQETGRRTGTTRMGSETKVAGRASGGPVFPGRTYRVGEVGEETLHMGANGGGYVVPGSRGRESSGGGNHVHLHFHGVVAAPSEAEGARLARVVAPHLQREFARAGIG